MKTIEERNEARKQKIKYCKNSLKIGNLYIVDIIPTTYNTFFDINGKYLNVEKDSKLIFLGFIQNRYLHSKEKDIAVFYSSGQEIRLNLFILFWNEPELTPIISEEEIIFMHCF